MAIKDLLARRRQVMQMRIQKLNRKGIMGQSLEQSCKRLIKVFDLEIKRLEKKLNQHVQQQAEWSERREILNTFDQA